MAFRAFIANLQGHGQLHYLFLIFRGAYDARG
jgi:hypothetical protein